MRLQPDKPAADYAPAWPDGGEIHALQKSDSVCLASAPQAGNRKLRSGPGGYGSRFGIVQRRPAGGIHTDSAMR